MMLVESRIDRSIQVRPAARLQAGFSLAEVALVVAIIGILAVLATPMFLSYRQGAVLRVSAQEVAALTAERGALIAPATRTE